MHSVKPVPTYATNFKVGIAALGGLGGYFLHAIRQAGRYCSGHWLVETLLSVPSRLSAARAFQAIPLLPETLAFMLGLAFAIPIFLGMRGSRKDVREQIALFLLGAMALLLFFWPFYLGARGGIPLLPFLVTFLWRGLGSKAVRVAFVALLFLNVPGNVWLSYKVIRTQEEESPRDLAALRQAASWINETGGTRATVAAGRDVPSVQLSEYLGRRVLANARPISESKFADVDPKAQHSQWVDYVVADSSFDPEAWARARYRVERMVGKWTIARPRR